MIGVIVCYIACVMFVTLYNICHNMLYNIKYVVLYNICDVIEQKKTEHVMLYNMCHVMLQGLFVL